MGVFTYYLLQALESATSETTYRDLFERVSYSMTNTSRRQNPQLEGDADTRLLDGTAVPRARYLSVQDAQAGYVTLPAGLLHGVTVGSRYALYRAETRDFDDPANYLADAEITSVGTTTARAKVLTTEGKPFNSAELAACRAVEKEHQYGEFRLKVKVSLSVLQADHPPGATALTKALTDLPVADPQPADAAAWDVSIECQEGDNGPAWVLTRAWGGVLARIDLRDPTTALARVRDALEREARWQMVRGLENNSSGGNLCIDLRVVKVTVFPDEETGMRYEDAELGDDPQGVVLQEGDHIMIELCNTGKVDCYVTVLDLDADGKIGPLWPKLDARVDDNKIQADGQWHRIRAIFRIGKPYSTEIFQAIATQQPSNFSPLLDEEARGRGVRARGENSLPGQLLRLAVTNTRTDIACRGGLGDWATAAFVFDVRP
jgi:hypothetical protein